MSKKSDGLLADHLGDRWSFTQVTTGATVTASVGAPQSANSLRVMDALSIMVANKNAIGHTVTWHVKEVVTGATVSQATSIAQWHMFVANSSTAQVNPANLNLYAGKGLAMHMYTDTVLGSVTSSVNATGWTDDTNN